MAHAPVSAGRMMGITIGLLVSLWAGLYAGATAAEVENDAHSSSSVAAEIDLDTTEKYVEKLTCIELRRIKRTQPIGVQGMLFYMRDGTVLLNQFINECPPMNPTLTMSFESRFAGRFCQLDRISMGDRIMGIIGFCNIGFFEEVSAEQAEMLRSETTRSGRAIIESLEKSDAP